MAHYIHDEKNNRIEGLSKEETYALLAAAIQQGQLPSVDEDTAFVTMFKSIVDGKAYKMAFCTQTQYNELETNNLLEADALYIITNDATYDDIETAIENINDTLDWVVEHINTGIRQNITSISCAFDFSSWQTYSQSYTNGSTISQLSLNFSNAGAVNILPPNSNTSIAEAKIEYVSGDSGYIQYNLQTISASGSTISFNAVNISGSSIYGLGATSSSLVTKTTTFRLYVKDIYGTEFTQEFTVSYKVIGT